MSPSQLGAFARSCDARDSPDLEYHVQALSLDRFGEPSHSFPAFTASVRHLRPSSRGEIHIKSPDPFVARNRAELSVHRRGSAGGREGREENQARSVLPHRRGTRAGSRRDRDDDLPPGRHLQDGAGQRPGGGGRRPAALPPRTRLRIVDASVTPRVTSGNANSPTLTIAEKAAAMTLADQKPE